MNAEECQHLKSRKRSRWKNLLIAHRELWSKKTLYLENPMGKKKELRKTKSYFVPLAWTFSLFFDNRSSLRIHYYGIWKNFTLLMLILVRVRTGSSLFTLRACLFNKRIILETMSMSIALSVTNSFKVLSAWLNK